MEERKIIINMPSKNEIEDIITKKIRTSLTELARKIESLEIEIQQIKLKDLKDKKSHRKNKKGGKNE